MFLPGFWVIQLKVLDVDDAQVSLSPNTHRSMLPVPPNVTPTISLELDVDDGEVENYEVAGAAGDVFARCRVLEMNASSVPRTSRLC